jgi:hypothetical protein
LNLTDRGSSDSGQIVPGNYSVTETPVAGWDLTSTSCDNGGANPSSIILAAGKTVTCTLTNTQRGHIIVKNVTNPSGSSQSFAFTAGWGSFSLTGGGSSDSGPIVPGSYSVSETSVAGWDQTATCDNGGSPGSITLAAGQTVTCTFSNTQRGHIIVKKVTNPSGSSQSFAFTAGWGSFSLTGGGSTDSGPLVPGSYSVSESPSSGWTQTSATCDNGGSPSSITLAVGQTVTCTFVNTIVIHPATTLTTQGVTPGTSVYPGTPVTITVTETNTGDSAITNVSVTGTGCTSWLPASVASLAAGASASFTCSFAPMATTAWAATGQGTDLLGNAVPLTGETTKGTVTILADKAPVCKVYDNANPPYMSYQAMGSGIVKLTVTTNLYNNFNVTITPAPNAFSPSIPGQPYPIPSGTIATYSQPNTSLIQVAAVWLDHTKSAQLVVQATDAAGKSVSCDPIQTTVTRLKQDDGTQTFTQVSSDEHYVRIESGGLKELDVVVNGTTFNAKRLTDDEVQIIDIQSAMTVGDGNTITLVPKGKKGESASVTIGPTP